MTLNDIITTSSNIYQVNYKLKKIFWQSAKGKGLKAAEAAAATVLNEDAEKTG